jgi:molybdenum-dependent DNA-binding transcriptional regulator ModE
VAAPDNSLSVPDRLERRPQDEELQELLLAGARLLLTLAETGSVPETAKELGVDVRQVQRRLKALNEAAIKLAGPSRALVAVNRGRGGASLTHHGLKIAKDLKPIYRQAQGVVAQYARQSRYIEITTTSECLGMFEVLTKSEDLRLEGISLLPAHRRTTEVHADLRRLRDAASVTPLAFYSVAVEERPADKTSEASPPLAPIRGAKVPVVRHVPEAPFQERVEVQFHASARGEDHRSLWPLKVDEFKLLARPELGERYGWTPDRDEVDVQHLLAERWVLLAPRWGAVAQYLELTVPSYWKFGEVRDCTDMSTGWQSLCRDLIPRKQITDEGGQVMIVHGLPESQARRAGLQLFRIRRPQHRRPIWALTGLFMNQTLVNACDEAENRLWNAIWRSAKDRVWPANTTTEMRTAG